MQHAPSHPYRTEFEGFDEEETVRVSVKEHPSWHA